MKMLKIAAVVGFALCSTTTFAVDTATGKTLVDDNCYSCHENEVYTREKRMVTSRPGLSKQVQRCELSLGLKWFDEDVENAAEYLNQQFYHFK